MSVKTYSPKSINVIVAGVPMTGYSEDTFVTVERSVDAFSTSVGADGEVARIASADKTGTIVLTLQQTSDSNAVLSALHLADEISLTGKFPVTVQDSNGNSLHAAGTAWISKVADAEYGADLTDREWTISCADLESFVGSNDS